jgi:hypothetical protein
VFSHFSLLKHALVVTPRTDDDDIVAGPQKMSLKCPVSKSQYRQLAISYYSLPLAELRARKHSLPLVAVRSSPVLRCYIVVFSNGADNDMAVSRMRKDSEF